MNVWVSFHRQLVEMKSVKHFVVVSSYITLTLVPFWSLNDTKVHNHSLPKQVSWARLKAMTWAVTVNPGVWRWVFTGKALQTSCGTPWPPCWEDGHSYGSASPGSARGDHTPTCTHDRRRLREDEMDANIITIAETCGQFKFTILSIVSLSSLFVCLLLFFFPPQSHNFCFGSLSLA